MWNLKYLITRTCCWEDCDLSITNKCFKCHHYVCQRHSDEIFDYEEDNPDLMHFKIYDSNIFDKDIVLMEESSPVIMSKIQEYNIGNIKFDMGNPLIDTEKDKVIEELKSEIINNKNHSLNII